MRGFMNSSPLVDALKQCVFSAEAAPGMRAFLEGKHVGHVGEVHLDFIRIDWLSGGSSCVLTPCPEWNQQAFTFAD